MLKTEAMQKCRYILPGIFTALLLGISGCNELPPPDTNAKKQFLADKVSVPERWYSSEQVTRGNELFQANCAVCHKTDASGTSDWKQTDAAGKLPPPPLNGTAHTWHHSLPVLRRVVKLGGVRLGGSMPGFGDKLSEEQIDAILAWVQSHWPDRIYAIWHERSRMN